MAGGAGSGVHKGVPAPGHHILQCFGGKVQRVCWAPSGCREPCQNGCCRHAQEEGTLTGSPHLGRPAVSYCSPLVSPTRCLSESCFRISKPVSARSDPWEHSFPRAGGGCLQRRCGDALRGAGKGTFVKASESHLCVRCSTSHVLLAPRIPSRWVSRPLCYVGETEARGS